MNIVYACTRNYYHKLLPSMRSLAEHEPKARVFILAEDDSLGIELPMKAEVINVSDQQFFPKDSANYYNSFTYINLLKVCYASILPVNKVIHLDLDTIICDSLEGFWNINVTGKWVAAVPEYNGRYKPFGDMYYNMGVALINLAQIRKDKIEPEMVEYLCKIKQPFADQDAWHFVGIVRDKFVPVPVRFNESYPTGTTDNPAIVHYCGIVNWWEAGSMPRKEYLDKYR